MASVQICTNEARRSANLRETTLNSVITPDCVADTGRAHVNRCCGKRTKQWLPVQGLLLKITRKAEKETCDANYTTFLTIPFRFALQTFPAVRPTHSRWRHFEMIASADCWRKQARWTHASLGLQPSNLDGSKADPTGPKNQYTWTTISYSQ